MRKRKSLCDSAEISYTLHVFRLLLLVFCCCYQELIPPKQSFSIQCNRNILFRFVNTYTKNAVPAMIVMAMMMIIIHEFVYIRLDFCHKWLLSCFFVGFKLFIFICHTNVVYITQSAHIVVQNEFSQNITILPLTIHCNTHEHTRNK